MVRKKFFTLVEMLVVLAILSLVAGVAGYNMLKMRRDQQFRSGVALVEQKLQASLETMLLHQDNVKVLFTQNSGKLTLAAETEIPLENGIGRLLQKPTVLEGIQSVVWVFPEGRRSNGNIELEFSAIENGPPPGTLILQGNEPSQKKTIVLKGFPHPIKSTDSGMYADDDRMRSEELYPKEVREAWRLQ